MAQATVAASIVFTVMAEAGQIDDTTAAENASQFAEWAYPVAYTAVANIGSKSGHNARKWKKWGKIPYVTYEEEIDMSNEELKALIRQTVKEVLDEENPVYKDLKDVPEYWKGAAAALLDSGAVNGGTPKEVCATDLNLRKETLKAAIVAVMYHEAREKA